MPSRSDEVPRKISYYMVIGVLSEEGFKMGERVSDTIIMSRGTTEILVPIKNNIKSTELEHMIDTNIGMKKFLKTLEKIRKREQVKAKTRT